MVVGFRLYVLGSRLEVGELEALQLICYLLPAIRAALPAGVTAIDYQVAAGKKVTCI